MDRIISEVISWPTQEPFRISRSVVSEVTVVVVTITKAQFSGRGECRPYARYNETAESVCQQIESLKQELLSLSHDNLAQRLPNGAARNAIDCALWDLKAQMTGKAVHELLNLPAPKARETAFTLSLASPEKMAKAAKAAASYKLLKIKIGDLDGLDCALAVLKARPDAKLIIDANEALKPNELAGFQSKLAGESVALIEQPIAAGTALPGAIENSLPLMCADESLHTTADLSRLWTEGYRAVNIKLDKAGGLSEGIELAKAAKAMGFKIMLGCMVSSSLSMAPALVLESYADIIDLDGALLLARDHENGMRYDNGHVYPAPKALWGYPRSVKAS